MNTLFNHRNPACATPILANDFNNGKYDVINGMFFLKSEFALNEKQVEANNAFDKNKDY